MALLQNTYGKGRVRVLRLYRDGQYHEPRETTAKVLLEGDFGGSYTGPDNSKVIATDSVKNIVNVVGRESLRLSTEEYGVAIAKKFLDGYAQVSVFGQWPPAGAVRPWIALSLAARAAPVHVTEGARDVTALPQASAGIDLGVAWSSW